jgi:hypothetical protein
MAEYFKGTLLASPIVRGSSGDTYGTHHSVLGVGGYMEFKTLDERDALPVNDDETTGLNYDEISSGQRRLGMIVHVLDTNELYHLHPKTSGGTYITLTEWYSLYPTNSAKINALGDNNNWYVLPFGIDSEDIGERISKEYTQSGNSFQLGDILGHNGTEFLRVNAFTAKTYEPLGIVTTSGSTFILTFVGRISTTGIVDYTGNTLSAATVYYLASTGFTGWVSDFGDGKLTNIAPTGLDEMSKPMLVTTSISSGIVLQYRGMSKSEQGLSIGQFNIYTGDTQTKYLDQLVTGATNIGYFTGYTSVQTIDILTSIAAYNGTYHSVYNNYYRDINGIIRIGTPDYHGVLRRGYVSNFTPKKSWLYNKYTGSSNQIGWILVDGDITVNVGNFLTAGNTSANVGFPVFTQTEWWNTGSNTGDTGGTGYYTNSAIALDVNGSLYSGGIYNIGGPVFSNKEYQELHFRTLLSKGSQIEVTYDNNFIYISGGTFTNVTGATGGINIGSGVGVYSGITGNILEFKSIIGSGGTIITDNGDSIIIYTSGGSGAGMYNLSSPSVIPLGGICSGTILTGKTAFQLFEELLVPELCGVITAPSIGIGLSSTGTFEIGCSLSQTVTGTFSRGCINPQYCSISNKRSGSVNAYCFTGTGMPSGFQTCLVSPAIRISSGYTVISGSQSWGVCASYNAGNPALGSKGTQYCAALISGCTSASSASITGIYPYYYGKLTCGIRPPVSNNLITGGSKVVSSSTGTVTLTFSSSSSEYTWVAIPSTSTSKTCWYVNALDNGNINSSPGDKYPDECVFIVCSGEGCWSSINYKIYMSGTVGAITDPIQFRNS